MSPVTAAQDHECCFISAILPANLHRFVHRGQRHARCLGFLGIWIHLETSAEEMRSNVLVR